MKILGHVHTFNDAGVIDRCLEALAAQTVSLDEILLVDNASTDGTLERDFEANVHVVRHAENTGTSGAVITGMRRALELGFDWIWIFDADSAPRPDALHELLRFYESLPLDDRERVQNLASTSPPSPHGRPFHGMRFTDSGFDPVYANGVEPVRCDAVIWSGSLYRVDAIRRVGLPSADYVLDWGEFEYGYLGATRGLVTYMVPASRFDHDTGETGTTYFTTHGWGPLRFRLLKLPAIRIYYLVRNELYFWLHEFEARSRAGRLRALLGRGWLGRYAIKLLLARRWQSLTALVRGVRDGLAGRTGSRF